MRFALTSTTFDYARYDYVVSSCAIYESAQPEFTYTFYDYKRSECQNKAIDLRVAFDHEKRMWQLRHLQSVVNSWCRI